MPTPGGKPGLPEVLFFHTVSIGQYGGSEGVGDEGAVLAALERSWQASFGREHFASPFAKAAALIESIIRRHPFVDGNKRTGTASAAYLLSTFGYEVQVEQEEQEELEDFAVAIAEGTIEPEGIALWFQEHTRKS